MTHLDLFSGYAGFTIPASKYGIETIGFSEIDKYACSVLKYNFKDIKNYGDITKLKGEDLPSIDIVTGGFPCQAFSVAGKRLGLEDTRGSLVYEFIRIIKEVSPKYFVGENVKGLLSIQGGDVLEMICEELCGAGYAIEIELLNAKDFGVPQNRERLFIVGKRLDLCKDFEVI